MGLYCAYMYWIAYRPMVIILGIVYKKTRLASGKDKSYENSITDYYFGEVLLMVYEMFWGYYVSIPHISKNTTSFA